MRMVKVTHAPRPWADENERDTINIPEEDLTVLLFGLTRAGNAIIQVEYKEVDE